MTKTTYAVQWHDGSKWRTTHDYRGNTLEAGLTELDLHKAYYPSIDARLVKLETITTVQQITLSTPEDT